MAVTRSRRGNIVPVVVNNEELEDNSVRVKKELQLPLKKRSVSKKSLKLKEHSMRQESLKQRQEAIAIFTKLKPSYKSKTDKVAPAFQIPTKTDQSMVFNFKQHISSADPAQLIGEENFKLNQERQEFLKIFQDLYQYKPTKEEMLNDIKKLPNFSKRITIRKKRLPLKPTSIVTTNETKKYPLTISNLYKDFKLCEVTSLKQNEILRTCEALKIRLKNIHVEERKFDLNEMKIIEDDIYPMDEIYLRHDESELDLSNGNDFILEGLNELDYLGERDFEQDTLINL